MTPDEANRLLQTALAQHRAGKIAEAERLYRQVLSSVPDHFQSWANLGLLLLNVRRAGEAANAFNAAASLAPKSAPIHNSLGDALTDAGEWGLAQYAYGTAIALEPNFY